MTSAARRRRDPVGWLSLAYLAAMLLLWLVQLTVGDRHWLGVAIVYTPKAPLLLPSLLLGAVALVLRRWRALALNAAATATCALLLMHWVLPRPLPPAPREGTPLRVMTFNIHYGAAGVQGIARAIREAAPDLVCLQEVKAGPGASDPAPALIEAFDDWRRIHRGEYLIASRHPLRGGRELPLGAGHRSLLAAEVKVGDRVLTVYNVHFATAMHGQALGRRRGSLPQYLEHTAAVRHLQAQALARQLAAERAPLLVAGDFNAPPGSRIWRPIRPGLTDTFTAAGRGFGFTFPNRFPLLRIDYLLAGPEFQVRRCRVMRTGVSDHCALVADLVLKPRSAPVGPDAAEGSGRPGPAAGGLARRPRARVAK